jgi:hypothetical protein
MAALESQYMTILKKVLAERFLPSPLLLPNKCRQTAEQMQVTVEWGRV